MPLSPHAPLVLPWRRTQVVASALLVIACALSPARCVRALEARDTSADPRAPGTALLYADTLDANAAAREDFETLPGIGPAKAAAIVSAREQRRGFCDAGEVRKAAGVGGARWERIAPLIRVTPSPRCSSSSRG